MTQDAPAGNGHALQRMHANDADINASACALCNGLVDAVPLDHGHRLTLLRRQAAQGCRTCELVSDAVLAINQEEQPSENLRVGWDTMRIRGLRVVVGADVTGLFLFGIDLYSPDDGDDKSLPWRMATECERPIAISGDTSSDEALGTLVRWIDDCSQHHSCKGSAPTPLPTRLIDVKDAGNIRLHCTAPGETGTYACLSHCWGTCQTLQTTTANLGQHRDTIPWHDVPNVLRDAIDMVRKLGIRYLWADSLCIVQDSESDWRRESASMANVYANSTITIAASLASGDAEPLFATAPVAHLAKTLHAHGVYARKTLAHGHGAQPLPLMSRAWVLQERLLSPRVVHFTPEELVWECMEALRCECGCIRSLWSPGHVPFDKDLLSAGVLRGAPSRAAVRERWLRLVQEYSRLELSLDRDRLPAVAGAARRVKDFAGGRGYLAGLWRHGLVGDLLWERKGDGATRRLEGIPSWSWASLWAEVLYDEAMATEELGVVLEASCDLLRDDDEFGEVHGGTVRLSVLTGTVSIRRPPEGDLPSVSLNAGGMSRRCGDEDLVLDGDGQLSGGDRSLLCAKMALRRSVYRTGSDQEVWLVLTPVDGQEGVFQRVGLLRTDVGDADESGGEQPEAEVVAII
ncbi:heterokaryon incompatibility protein [Purpureocillium lilacinum]|uniref:Heterokaryon incompatibility protein n=1 Tax=Purpureocillium lilacinum TaxID=33203 RepID=A0A179HJE8_PURLI|nr:heterokaryon incompatibility protein [Purpureocillium lilacinum]OAQ90114.1 heterokaryon incompatibility protein [Purpureocillium lilacinum]